MSGDLGPTAARRPTQSRSWREARTALRFTTPCESVVHYAAWWLLDD